MRVGEKILRITCAVLLSAAALALASSFVDTGTAWYQGLQKPELVPPPLVFRAAWVLLYLLFAASLALVSQGPGLPRPTFLFYLAAGVLNALWTYAFFFRQRAAGAVLVLLLIVMTALPLFMRVYRASRIAAYLLIPYMVWISFALYLNYETAFLN